MSDADHTPYSNQDNSSPETLPEEMFDEAQLNEVTPEEPTLDEANPAESLEAFARARATEIEEDDEERETERVSKLIAKAGIASRRAAEEMIAAGRITVNGHVITEQGFKADPYNDRIVVDGHPLRVSEKPGVVLVFHKPRLVMTTRDDPGGRTTVMDFLPRKWQSLHPVGRLDFDTSGVLLLTDDGELTHLLTHPSHGAEKVYEARVRGVVEHNAIEKLERGVRLDDGPTAPCRAKVMAQRDKNALIQLVIREGRNRQVRRMLEAVGHPVNALRRVSFAGVELEGLPAGEFRVLLAGEVKALRKRVEDKKKRLSAPKGKFSKHKVPKPTEKKAEEKAPAVPKSKLIADKKAVRRPRNAPAAPAAPPLERKGSKARAISDAQKASKRAPRPRPSDFREEPRNPRSPSSRPSSNQSASSKPPSSKPSSSKPSSSRAPRPEERPDRAPVAGRIQKRWKS
jgi:23S rRNA pseudouridine2605 synthase